MFGPVRKLFNESPTFRVALGFAAACLSLTILGFAAVQLGYFAGFDGAVRATVSQPAAPWVTTWMRLITQLGSTRILTLVGVAAIIAFAAARWWRAIGLFLIGMAGQIILHHGFKALFERPRPEALFGYRVGDSYSFPSGHALASLSVYGMLAWLITNRMRPGPARTAIWIAAAASVLLIGLSRVYFGVHNATDVIAGYLAAFIWTASVASADNSRSCGQI
jgi:undecaprenyl-diphosphatase